MLAIVNTPGGPEPAAIREVAEPEQRPNEALVAVRAFSLNRGELRLMQPLQLQRYSVGRLCLHVIVRLG